MAAEIDKDRERVFTVPYTRKVSIEACVAIALTKNRLTVQRSE